MRIDRRRFLFTSSALGAGFFGLHALLNGGEDWAPDPSWVAEGYGALVPDPEGLVDLPAGFRYSIFSQVGEEMDDGLLVPGAHDGMAAFAGADGKTILVRNHELRPGARGKGAFGDRNERLKLASKGRFYDYGSGEKPGLGGTTTIVFDTRTQQVEGHWLSLAGTIRNCAGGLTPWGSWLSCEETTDRRGGTTERNHGYNFEVPSDAKKLVDARPLTAMGRFNHEAVAVHPASGAVYQTEDRDDGLFYRFVPDKPGKLAAGGKLQALALRRKPSADVRNWRARLLEPGEAVDVRWIDLEEVDAPKDDLREQGFQKGAARFARGEGIWADGDDLYFACTNGGSAKSGQIFRYAAGENEARPGEKPGRLELFLESPDRRLLEYADNLTVAPWGDLVLCEDGRGTDHVIGVTPDAKCYQLARNAKDGGEFAGACFSPDGSTLFVNIQGQGLTLAITGPWDKRSAA